MALSESRKKANRDWDKENMSTLACKLKKEDAERFRLYCSVNGVTVNGELKGHVMRCIGEEIASEATEAPKGIQGYSLSPESMKKAQGASEATGETPTAFIERAIETQAGRDKTSLAMGINPASHNREVK